MIKYSPAMTFLEFGHLVGVSEGVVDGWAKRDYIPTVKIGKYRLVNVAKFHHELTNSCDGVPNSGVKEFLRLKSNFDKLPRNERRKLLKAAGGDIEEAVFSYTRSLSGSAG